MAITKQAQRAVEAMKAAGFERREFSVRTEGNGKTGFGDALVTCYAPKSAQIGRAEAMALEGLAVTRIWSGDYEAYPAIVAGPDAGMVKYYKAHLPAGERAGVVVDHTARLA